MRFEIDARRVLLLQGPIGPFFRRFADDLEDRGVAVTKVNFSPGDAAFYRGRDVIAFKQPMARWPEFLRDLLAERRIEAVFLFGDCRPHHRRAVEICNERGIPVWVFEEGYLRPDYVTMERGGVNGNSSLPKDPDFYRRAAADLPELSPPAPVGATFAVSALYAAVYSWSLTLFGWRYPHYRHHRNYNALRQGYYWGRGLGRKWRFRLRERGLLDGFRGERSGRYFFVPLQVHCDAQLYHSRFSSMEEFMEEIVATFAANAPADCQLVLKHHPADRPYREYGRFLRDLAARHGIAERLVYVHDLHLPTLLKNARGTVTMNSTVGLSSLYHKTPVKVLGNAVYDLPGLTCQRSLADFFRDPGEFDESLYHAFCRWLLESNQVNGSIYKRLPGTGTRTGLRFDDLRPRSTVEPGQPSGEAAAS